jgi:hypothetical protein
MQAMTQFSTQRLPNILVILDRIERVDRTSAMLLESLQLKIPSKTSI